MFTAPGIWPMAYSLGLRTSRMTDFFSRRRASNSGTSTFLISACCWRAWVVAPAGASAADAASGRQRTRAIAGTNLLMTGTQARLRQPMGAKAPKREGTAFIGIWVLWLYYQIPWENTNTLLRGFFGCIDFTANDRYYFHA